MRADAHRRIVAVLLPFRCGRCKGRSSLDRAQALLSALHPLPSRCIIFIYFF